MLEYIISNVAGIPIVSGLLGYLIGFFDSWFNISIAFFIFMFYKYTSIRSDFGARLVVGAMGVAKSFTVFYMAYRKSKIKGKHRPLIIANIPYDFVDIHYESKNDLKKIVKFFEQYMIETNEIDILKVYYNRFRPVIFIVDETHLYFFSTDTSSVMSSKGDNIGEAYRTLFTQLRKRYIQMFFITQVYAQVMAFLRRLVPFVTYLGNFVGFIRTKKGFFVKKDDTDIKDPNIAELQLWQFRLYLHPELQFLPKEFSSQQYLSHYCVNTLHDVLNDFTYREFRDMLYFLDERPPTFFQKLLTSIRKRINL